MYLEALAILRQALTSRKLTFHGQFYDYADVPVELGPFQKPHPPFWAGVGTPEGGEIAGRNGFNMVANALTAGSPATVTRMIRSQLEDTGIDYFVAQLAFGDLTLSEILRTVDLFAHEVMPALQTS